MFLILLYHRVGEGKWATPLSLLNEHFEWISNHFTTVHPGDSLIPKPALCLTFDDATFDFYYYIFPLLKKWQLKAVLGVPVGLIPEETHCSPSNRLKLAQNPPLTISSAYCSWKELREVKHSSLVHIASHSLSHKPFTSAHVDALYELQKSKALLSSRLECAIPTFIYPYGIFNTAVHRLAKREYQYIMRIGNAGNVTWENTNQLLYRIPTHSLSHLQPLFSLQNQMKYRFRFCLNLLRRR